MIKKTIIISGFPGIGKSCLFRQNRGLIVLDSDSSNFSWISNGVRNPEFPKNYIEHVKDNIGQAHIILVSSHKVVRDALRENGIEYVLVYPDKSLKDEYVRRYIDRGSDDAFVKMIENNWTTFIEEIESEVFPTKRTLKSGEYLTNVVKEFVYSVRCEGPCNSDLDDYCGYHMNIETCPACDSIDESR